MSGDRSRSFAERLLLGVAASTACGIIGGVLGIPFGPIGIAVGSKIGASVGAILATTAGGEGDGTDYSSTFDA